MVDDESLVGDIDRGFDKNKSLMKTTVSKIDKVLTSASGNILCYVFLFVIIVLVLLYKLTK
jgi:t-SNARE complex subunit (syntaxin)